jgi:caffeoyl-CoA O-methyltransferase
MNFCSDFSQIDIDSRLKQMRKTFKESGIPVITNEGLNMLLLMIKATKPKQILEIGTAVGLSGSAMLLACNNSILTTIDKDEKCINEAKKNFALFNVNSRVIQINADAMEAINIIDKKFDFIFLDGAKSQYKNYLNRLVEILNTGGILFVDNVLFRGYVSGVEETPKKYKSIVNNLKIFLEILKNEKQLETVILDIGDGISISVRRN